MSSLLDSHYQVHLSLGHDFHRDAFSYEVDKTVYRGQYVGNCGQPSTEIRGICGKDDHYSPLLALRGNPCVLYLHALRYHGSKRVAVTERFEGTLRNYLNWIQDSCFEYATRIVADMSEKLKEVVRKVAHALHFIHLNGLYFGSTFDHIVVNSCGGHPHIKIQLVNYCGKKTDGELYAAQLKDWVQFGCDLLEFFNITAWKNYLTGEVQDFLNKLINGDISSIEMMEQQPAMWTTDQRILFICSLSEEMRTNAQLRGKIVILCQSVFLQQGWKEIIRSNGDLLKFKGNYNDDSDFITMGRNSLTHLWRDKHPNIENLATLRSYLGVEQFLRWIYPGLLVECNQVYTDLLGAKNQYMLRFASYQMAPTVLSLCLS